MTERKRLSDTDESSAKYNTTKKIKLIQTTLPVGTSKRPICKYGASCYRKHPDHLRDYQHPKTNQQEKEQEEDDDEDFSTTSVSEPSTSTKEASPAKQITASSNSTISLMELAELSEEKLLRHLYQMKFPSDLHEFWNFCSDLKKTNPREVLTNLLNLELVGPFEILDGALNTCKTLPNIHLHYRYYYDTPEFMTVIRTLDKRSQFHIGYYRDSPDELPVFLASNDSSVNNHFKICGDNIFAAVHSYARHHLKSSDKSDLKTFVSDLESYAKKHKFSLDETTPTITARKKKVNCTLLNSLGMVVPCENDIGYRPVPFTKGDKHPKLLYFSNIFCLLILDQFKKVCDKFCNDASEGQRQKAEDDLQHVITCIQFANDECDYGEGLEFGLNLFLYGSSKLHSRILTLLPLAYKLLHRDLYGQIITDHLASGRSNLIEDLNEITKNS
ncbi:unnamed protein product [Adineta ricciae]|uniref:PBZ-type domain-containing protein n=1 Tax=Adineta ricciae TaxID=249248 RepID=A0A815XMS9_ADIRI|nr:unnamed protein product [Adineta ricciae]CAF1559771.1 unnamed protein product [Adineta ricciae]